MVHSHLEFDCECDSNVCAVDYVKEDNCFNGGVPWKVTDKDKLFKQFHEWTASRNQFMEFVRRIYDEFYGENSTNFYDEFYQTLHP